MTFSNPTKLVLSLLTTYSVAVLSFLFIDPIEFSETWKEIKRPPLYPSDLFYEIAWPILLTMMGISFYIIWKKIHDTRAQFAMTIFVLHLAIMAVWTFFWANLRNPVILFGAYIGLLATIYILIAKLKPMSKTASNLLIPAAILHTFGIIEFSMLLFMNWEKLSS